MRKEQEPDREGPNKGATQNKSETSKREEQEPVSKGPNKSTTRNKTKTPKGKEQGKTALTAGRVTTNCPLRQNKSQKNKILVPEERDKTSSMDNRDLKDRDWEKYKREETKEAQHHKGPNQTQGKQDTDRWGKPSTTQAKRQKERVLYGQCPQQVGPR